MILIALPAFRVVLLGSKRPLERWRWHCLTEYDRTPHCKEYTHNSTGMLLYSNAMNFYVFSRTSFGDTTALEAVWDTMQHPFFPYTGCYGETPLEITDIVPLFYEFFLHRRTATRSADKNRADSSVPTTRVNATMQSVAHIFLLFLRLRCSLYFSFIILSHFRRPELFNSVNINADRRPWTV